MFFRVLQEGHTLVYEPRAVVRHRHRPESARLRKQMRDWGTGFVAYMTRSARAYPGERRAFRSLASWWIRRRIIWPFLLSFVRRRAYPRDLIVEELRGALRSRGAYRRARRSAEQIAREHGDESDCALRHDESTSTPRPTPRTVVAVRTVDLDEPLRPIDDICDACAVRLYVFREGVPVAMREVPTGGQPLSVAQQRDLLADIIARQILKQEMASVREGVGRWLVRGDTVPLRARVSASPHSVDSVSIVVATFDRPDDLRRCLSGLVGQTTERRMEIIVVDNHPASRLTPPVVAEFLEVRLVSEQRQGLSYARNAGIAASSGAIVVAVDDDVVTPADWLDKLLVPFALADVMVVTGNVFPAKLETRAEQLFERYGGLGRGFERIEAGPRWFASWHPGAVPTWHLGATANAAFRATIFSHPEIGMLDPALGAGAPTGCSEDTDLFYRVLAAGFTIVYEPSAFVWHHHRREMRALQRQLYAYSKGHVAYHLTTWFRDRDARALIHLGYTIPKNHLKAILRWARRSRDYPLTLILTEIGGNLAGPWALWRARRRARRLGPPAGPPPAAVQRAENTAWSLAEEARDECRSTRGEPVRRPVGRQHSAISSSDATAAREPDMRIV
jgi:GT2 family glycosyltransferase